MDTGPEGDHASGAEGDVEAQVPVESDLELPHGLLDQVRRLVLQLALARGSGYEVKDLMRDVLQAIRTSSSILSERWRKLGTGMKLLVAHRQESLRAQREVKPPCLQLFYRLLVLLQCNQLLGRDVRHPGGVPTGNNIFNVDVDFFGRGSCTGSRRIYCVPNGGRIHLMRKSYRRRRELMSSQ